MSKIRLVALIAVLMLVLSACASPDNSGEGLQTPGAGGIETPFGTAEGGVPVTGETPAVTEPMATEPVTTEQVATTEPVETETVAATEPVETESPMVEESPTVEGTPGEGVPITGAAGLADPYPNALSEIDDYAVVDTNCEQVAAIDGYLVSVADGQILYVLANPSGAMDVDGRLLVPWSAFDVNLDVSAMENSGSMIQTPAVGDQTLSPEGMATEMPGGLQTTSPEGSATEAPGGGLAGGQPGECPAFDAGQALMLNVSPDEISGAPVIADDQDVNEFIGTEGWDEEFRSFWSDLGVEVNQAVGGASEMTQSTPAATEPAAGDQTQVAGTPGAEGEEMSSAQVGDTVFIESIGDLAVRNMADEDVASVEDLIIDPESAQISHVLLSVGGFLGIGDRFVPVPWEALDFQMENGNLVLVVDADQAQLEEAPGFDSLDEFPSTQEEGWESEFDSYWQTEG